MVRYFPPHKLKKLIPLSLQNALLQALDVPDLSVPLIVSILPALPAAWHSGSLKGARIRGGMSLSITWSESKPTKVVIDVASGFPPRDVEVVYEGKTIDSFAIMGSATTRTIVDF